jgi:hypothetical protein
VSDTLPTVIAPSVPTELVERLTQHAHAACGASADETLRAMRKASAALRAWATHNGLSALPAEPSAVATYIEGMSQFRAPASTSLRPRLNT